MSDEKQTTVQNTTQKVEPTPEEREMNRLLLDRMRATQDLTIQTQRAGLGLANELLTPTYLGKLSAGISPEAIGNQASLLAKQYGVGFQGSGIADSGVAFRETARGIANELLYPTEQFNIGALQNLLNLALSGQAQVQQPITANTGILASNLQGLRTTSTSGMSTTTMMNPFLKSFQQSAGSALGKGLVSGVGGMMIP